VLAAREKYQKECEKSCTSENIIVVAKKGSVRGQNYLFVTGEKGKEVLDAEKSWRVPPGRRWV
jgi:hypothetical protein